MRLAILALLLASCGGPGSPVEPPAASGPVDPPITVGVDQYAREVSGPHSSGGGTVHSHKPFPPGHHSSTPGWPSPLTIPPNPIVLGCPGDSRAITVLLVNSSINDSASVHVEGGSAGLSITSLPSIVKPQTSVHFQVQVDCAVYDAAPGSAVVVAELPDVTVRAPIQ